MKIENIYKLKSEISNKLMNAGLNALKYFMISHSKYLHLVQLKVRRKKWYINFIFLIQIHRNYLKKGKIRLTFTLFPP